MQEIKSKSENSVYEKTIKKLSEGFTKEDYETAKRLAGEGGSFYYGRK